MIVYVATLQGETQGVFETLEGALSRFETKDTITEHGTGYSRVVEGNRCTSHIESMELQED